MKSAEIREILDRKQERIREEIKDRYQQIDLLHAEIRELYDRLQSHAVRAAREEEHEEKRSV